MVSAGILMDPLDPTFAFLVQTFEKPLINVDLVLSYAIGHLALLLDHHSHRIAADFQSAANLPQGHSFFVQQKNGSTLVRFDHGILVQS